MWVLGVGMSKLGAQTALYVEYRGLQVPMSLEYDPVTSSGKSDPGPDPRIRNRIQIVMFRPIRVDHTNCLQVDIKTHSFILIFFQLGLQLFDFSLPSFILVYSLLYFLRPLHHHFLEFVSPFSKWAKLDRQELLSRDHNLILCK